MHIPVMVNEVLDLLELRAGGIYLDGTLGGGGHARALLERLNGDGILIGMDRDSETLKRATETLASWQDQCRLTTGNFADMTAIAGRLGFSVVDGVILDLGMSSWQIDLAERGFSFRQAGPLDMRMDRTRPGTAADLIAGTDESRLRDWLRRFGEEPAAGRVARAIIRARDSGNLRTTADLAEVTARACGGRRGGRRHIHPATRTFQALRIAVNGEMDALNEGLEAALHLLRPGGRLAVLSYHSLEDRQVKEAVRRHTLRHESLAEGGTRPMGMEPFVRAVNRKPLLPSEHEVESNPRARSARLRVVERIYRISDF